MFGNCLMGGLNMMITPDVCLTIITPPTPVPVPYPNFSLVPMGVPFAPNVFFMGAPAHFLATIVPMSEGDLPGIAGVMSGTVMGPTERVSCAPNVLADGLCTVRLTDAVLMNLTNALGATAAPSQCKVLIL
jgi:Domain of unknown function (DUF4150)